MPRNLTIPTSAVFEPLLKPARYKGAHGGRGSGKSHFFAGLGVEDCLRWPGEQGEGLRWACLRETQKSLRDSAKYLIESKIRQFGLGEADGFKIFNEVIKTPGDGLIVFEGMKDHTADSFKSKENVHRVWMEEAHTISQESLTLIRPTIRAANSEIWASWNPQRPTDAIDQLLRSERTPTDAAVVKALWSDNPWFPDVLDQERRDDLEMRPDEYAHIWEGDYARVLAGAYFARHLVQAELDGRIGSLAVDDLLKVYAFWDIGGTSDRSDAVAIWIVQKRGDEVRVLDYYEAIGQAFDMHTRWLNEHWPTAFCVLPHDGGRHDVVFSVTPQGFLSDAGFGTLVIPNQGRGAALQRIDALRRVFPRLQFDREKTEGGRDALGWYHEKKDEHRNIGLGPMHDWSSHAADAMGLCAVWLEGYADVKWTPLKRGLRGVA